MTAGLASSNLLTKGLRYQKFINKGIDVGLEASEKVAVRLNEMEDKVNAKIDKKVEAVREEGKKKTAERELPKIKEPDAESEDLSMYPGSKKFAW